MALFPAIGGIAVGGISWRNIWLAVAWTLCYCFQFSAARWLATRSHEAKDARKRHSNIYFVPAAVYLIITAAVGIPVFAFAPKLLWWIPAYAVLAALSFWAAWKRSERTLWGNAVSVIAAGGMALLSTSLGSRFFLPAAPHDRLASRLSPVLASNNTVASGANGSAAAAAYQGNPLSGLHPVNLAQYYLGSPLLPKTGVIAALAFILTEYASVLFVKTMIREHGHVGYYALSIGYHILLVALGFIAPTLLCGINGLDLPLGTLASTLLWGIPTVILLVRAVVFPLTHKRMKPVHIGMIEAVTSVMNLVVIALALA